MSRSRFISILFWLSSAAYCHAESSSVLDQTSIFAPISTPAHDVRQLSFFVLMITGGIFLGVGGLILYAIIRFRARPDDNTEPPQVFGSTQIELAWTIIPVLLITMLFLGTARVLFAVQDAPKPPDAVDVVAIGHQFWWEFRYPKYNIITANELHVPQSTKGNSRPTFLKLTSADVMHSFWVPRLGGKTDLLPNRVNEMWFDPSVPGIYLGQCSQFCGPEHARMLLRVYVDPPDKFDAWVKAQQQNQPEIQNTQGGSASPQPPQQARQQHGAKLTGAVLNAPPRDASVTNMQQASEAVNATTGQQIFEQQACINCHTVRGTIANGRYGPDLTHLMSRDTIGAGILQNTPQHLQEWVNDPNDAKPGCLMPAMHLTDKQNAQITAYLLTLK
ncbi:MAG TPA: cytochrome c oxidase subunit II [Acidobacteriaceae bacterium]|nr:cytochrome c oxidase subunit II [Acidobacteriaceae bacterium]